MMMDATLEAQAFTVLAVLAAALLVLVTGGVIYLTAAEWRDRRRRKRDQEANLPRRSTPTKKK
jgi:uncharacterized protein (DUF2062 family)